MNDPDTTAEKHHIITYSVNGEPERTETADHTAGDILTNAGFTPVADYRLISENPKHEYTSPSDPVKVHEGQRFEALHRGPTPTS